LSLKKIIFDSFARLTTIHYSDGELTPTNWCVVQPCVTVRIASREMILTQPTSTFLVYLLGILTTGVGVHFLTVGKGSQAMFWWGVALVLWGIGALLAGTSYQAFAYEIKCRGRSACSWTSWWEVIYLMFQQVSVNVILVAVACSCTGGKVLWLLRGYALINPISYCALVFFAAMVPLRPVLTFNFMVLVSAPVFLITSLLNCWRYCQYGARMDLVFLVTWALLFLTGMAYYIYDRLGLTEKLWAKGKGFWFSQNDVLHIGLILWVVYIGLAVPGQISDYPGAAPAGG
jgi:hypothetical protein